MASRFPFFNGDMVHRHLQFIFQGSAVSLQGVSKSPWKEALFFSSVEAFLAMLLYSSFIWQTMAWAVVAHSRWFPWRPSWPCSTIAHSSGKPWLELLSPTLGCLHGGFHSHAALYLNSSGKPWHELLSPSLCLPYICLLPLCPQSPLPAP
eukprot:1154474-Pelagomonas_calceolata.AAC.1